MNLPLLYVRNGLFKIADKILFSDVCIQIYSQDRICFIGKNGCGKTTFFQLLQNIYVWDQGENYQAPGLRIFAVPQEPVFHPQQTIESFLSEVLEPYQVTRALQEYEFSGDDCAALLSGGRQRQLLLARAFAFQPDVLLLDEPTNHLDIFFIEALEKKIKSYSGAVVMISHDKIFLENITKKMAWIANGHLRMKEKGYGFFDEWEEEILKSQEQEYRKLKQDLKAQEHWMKYGVTARRKRNQKRVENLHALRRQKVKFNQEMMQKNQSVSMDMKAIHSSKILIELKDINFFYTPDRMLIHQFSTCILKKERIAFLGKNGTGKTTLLKLLLKQKDFYEAENFSGEVHHATLLEIAYIDQQRSLLDGNRSVMDTVADSGSDFINVQGRLKHVQGYLKEFFFTPAQMRASVSTLSGGERNRLLLAKVFAKPSNILILDEPTNDLDVDTLDLLEDLIEAYCGTVILVSHDRHFIDKVATTSYMFYGEGNIVEYVGGYSDMRVQEKNNLLLKQKNQLESSAPPRTVRETIQKNETQKKRSPTLSYKYRHILVTYPNKIEEMSQKLQALEVQIADPALFQKDPNDFYGILEMLESLKHQKQTLEEDLLEAMELEEQCYKGDS